MKKKRIFSLLLSLVILSSSISGLAITSSAVEPVNRVNQSYRNTEYANFIVPADTIPAGAGYQQVEYISSNGSGGYFNFSSLFSTPNNQNSRGTSAFNYFKFSGFGSDTFLINSWASAPYDYNLSYNFGFTLSYKPDFNEIVYSVINSSSSTLNVLNNYNPFYLDSSYEFRVVNSSLKTAYYSVSLDDEIYSYDRGQFFTGSYQYTFLLLGVSNLPVNANNLNFIPSGFVCFNLFNRVVFPNYDNSIDLVPCYRTSDGTIGFYNLEDDSFITPTSQNGIYAGPDVVGVTEAEIIDQSGNQTIYLTGASPELYINATTEIGNITYQWQRSNPSPLGYTDWADIQYATQQFYTPPAFDDLGIYKFRCKVGSVLGSSGLYIYSDTINIEVVNADPDIPVIVTQPDSKVYYDTVQHLDNLFIEVAEMDEGQITYQWQYRDDNNIWRDIQGATNNTLNVDNRATHIGSYYYRCNVSNTLANVTKNVTSNVAEIKIIEYNSFEDFWRIFFNGGLGSINDVTSGINNITNNFPIEPGGSNQFIKMVGALYNSVVPGWFSAYIVVLFLALGIIVVLRGAGF